MRKSSSTTSRVKEGLEESGIVADRKEIGTKLHSLQVYYSAQRDKLEENSKKSGSGTDDTKESNGFSLTS